MRKLLLFLFFCISGFTAQAQVGFSYHQSALPFVGLNYSIGRFMPELRLSTDRYFEDVSFEAVLTFHYLRREDYQLYVGLGYYIDWMGAASIPLGIQIYPFENKRFGFHIEATPLVGEGNNILRGSWGIRYRFLKE